MKSSAIFTPLMAFLTTLAVGLSLLPTRSLRAQTVVKPRPVPPGAWTEIGTTVANYSVDHDSITVRGPFDDFRMLMFKVTEAPLNMHRVLVTYDNGEPEEIQVREKIAKGGKTRVIDLRGGTRSLRRIDFWYDTRGARRAEVTVYGKK